MRIRMLRTQTGSVDGYRIDTYQTGAEYDMGKTEKHTDLARVFLREGWAESVENESDREQVITEMPKSRVRRK